MKKDTAIMIGCAIALGVLRVLQYRREEKEREMTEAAMRRTEEIMRDWKPKVTFEVEKNSEEARRIEEKIRQKQERIRKMLESEEDPISFPLD